MKKRGIRSKRGNAYSVSVLSALLRNRKYIGEYKYGSVVTPGGIPAIIDKDLFERVQMRMAANKKAPARAKAEEEYLLTTKLFCGDCGRLMAGESGRGGRGVVYHYYKCSGAKRKLGCKRKAIKKHWIEDVVVKLTVSQVLTNTAIDRIADAIVVMQEQEDTVTPVLKQQLQHCETEIRNVMKAIRLGIITDTTKECLEDLEAQRESLKESIAQLQLERRSFSKEEIVEWISKYKNGNINDPDYRKEIIDTFVNSVYVYDDKLILTYNYKDGSQTLTLQEINAALSSDLTSICPPEKPSRTESEKVFLFTRPIGGAPLNVGQTKQFYAQLKSSDLCSCAYCQNYIRQIRAACPGAAEYLRRMGADIEKPFEVIPLDVDEAGYADYLCAQYILCGDAGDFAETVVDALHIRLAEAHPSTRLTQAHFVIELYPIRLKWVMGK